MDFADMGIELPPAVKQAAARIADSAKIAARGLGKAAIVLDPIFMAMDASEASRKGATGSQIGEFVGKSFAQDLLNLPNVLTGAGKYASDFLQGKRGDDLNFDGEMLYKNRTFADDNTPYFIEEIIDLLFLNLWKHKYLMSLRSILINAIN